MFIPTTDREKGLTPLFWEYPHGQKCGVPWAATAPLPSCGSFQTSGAIPRSHSMIHHYSFHSSSKVYASRIIFLSMAYPIFSHLTLLQPKYWFKEPLLPDIFRWAPITEREMLICALFSGQLQFSMHKYWQLHNVSSQVYPKCSKLMEKSLSAQHSYSIKHFTGATTSSPRNPLRGRSPLHLFGEGKLDFPLERLCSGIRLQNGYSHQHTRLDGSAALCSFWRPRCCFLHE